MPTIAIIGAGLAGLSVARELRKLRPELDVVVVTEDDGHQYPKPQLSTALRLGKQPDDLILQRAEAIAATGVRMVTRTRVQALDPHKRHLTLADGSSLNFDELVLATGASPFVPPMQGAAEGVMTVNHLDDYRHFRERLTPGKPVLLVGGGLIGMEFTADLTSQGYTVHVVDPGPGALPRLLPPGAAGLLTTALAKAGANFFWQRTVAHLEGTHGDYYATLSDGETLSAGTVLSAVGLRPQVTLAREAGLPVQRGIAVDGHLRAAPHIYALGDCAELPGGIYLPFIRPIGEQAKYVAQAIAGDATAPFAPTNYAIAVKVPQWPVSSTTPVPGESGDWHEEVDDAGSLSRLVATDGRLMRVVATGSRVPELKDWLPQVPSLSVQLA